MKIKYIDHRPLVIPYLTYHRAGLTLPSGDNIVKVNDDEANSLLKMKNGRRPCFIEIKDKKEEIINEVIEDDSRE